MLFFLARRCVSLGEKYAFFGLETMPFHSLLEFGGYSVCDLFFVNGIGFFLQIEIILSSIDVYLEPEEILFQFWQL